MPLGSGRCCAGSSAMTLIAAIRRAVVLSAEGRWRDGSAIVMATRSCTVVHASMPEAVAFPHERLRRRERVPSHVAHAPSARTRRRLRGSNRARPFHLAVDRRRTDLPRGHARGSSGLRDHPSPLRVVGTGGPIMASARRAQPHSPRSVARSAASTIPSVLKSAAHGAPQTPHAPSRSAISAAVTWQSLSRSATREGSTAMP